MIIGNKIQYSFSKDEIKLLQYAISFTLSNLGDLNESLRLRLDEGKLQRLLNKIQSY